MKNGSFYAELNEKAKAATGSYSVTGDPLHYIYSVPMTKDHRNIRSRCLVHEFSFRDNFWLILFYMVMATYFYYEKVRRTMHTLQLYQTSLIS